MRIALPVPEVPPTCELCDEPWEDGGEGEDWNGETGNHRSCEAERAVQRAPAQIVTRHWRVTILPLTITKEATL